MPGRALAEREQVQLAGVEGGDGQADHRARQHREHLGPGGLGERTELPERDLGELRAVREEDGQTDERPREGVHGDAREDQGDHFRTAARAGQGVDEQDGDEPGGERAERHSPVAQEVQPERDRAGRADRRARRDPDDARLGQRIAEHALGQRPRAPERGPDEQGEDHPGQPYVPEHALADPVERMPAEPRPVADRAEHVGEGDVVRAEPGGEQGEHEQGGGQGDGEGPGRGGPAGLRDGRAHLGGSRFDRGGRRGGSRGGRHLLPLYSWSTSDLRTWSVRGP